MSDSEFQYKGYSIGVQVFRDPQNRWNWIYTFVPIKSDPGTEKRGMHDVASRPTADRDTTIAEAEQAAKEEIDRLIASNERRI
ncbi:hypothetical protein [Caballeronia sp. TF1N1]|uniref:hypothetical protein n=1 Tax=Caballeronia sp. TF1N1 TaxID=2878153 RepID=UPI001FCFE6E4|nr:hypothetical protein [Caballeronia sp. TF1N1]